jgi:hypothetical protein
MRKGLISGTGTLRSTSSAPDIDESWARLFDIIEPLVSPASQILLDGILHTISF